MPRSASPGAVYGSRASLNIAGISFVIFDTGVCLVKLSSIMFALIFRNRLPTIAPLNERYENDIGNNDRSDAACAARAVCIAGSSPDLE